MTNKRNKTIFKETLKCPCCEQWTEREVELEDIDVSINLTMDYTKVPYGNQRNSLILKKPSVVEPMATQIADLLKEVSPQGEPGVRKYFVSPPTENWNPKEGTYNFNISFTYELDK